MNNRKQKWSSARSSIYVAVVFLLFVSCLSITARGQQSTTADILGTVSDPTGATIPGAQVTVTNTGTEEKRSATTGSTGDYVFNVLQPGNYNVTITSGGFQSFSESKVQIVAGDRRRVDAQLKVGASSQTVNVEAQASALQTDSSSLLSSVSQSEVQDIPLNGRNFVNLVQVQPGVSQGSPTSFVNGTRLDDLRQSASYSANGQEETFNNNMIDGADNNERQVGTIAVHPSIDSIAGLTVYTNDYPADVSRTAGAVVNVITKSGTNAFHGDVFEYFRNTVLDAENYSFGSVLPRTQLNLNQYGGSLGGPIVHDKTFFFGDYEGYNSVAGLATVTNTVPTLFEERNPGNFSDVGGAVYCTSPGVPAGCTGSIDAAGLAFFKLYPAPNKGTNQYVGVPGEVQYSHIFDVRVDHHFNAKDWASVRLGYNNVTTHEPQGSTAGGFPTTTVAGVTLNPSSGALDGYDFDFGLLINFTHIFSPNLLATGTAAYTRDNNQGLPATLGTNFSQAIGQPNVNTPVGQATSLAAITVTGGARLGAGTQQPVLDQDNTFQYTASFNYTHGSHNMKYGATLVRRQLTNLQSTNTEGSFSFTGYPNLIQGLYLSVSRNLDVYPPHLRMWELGGYAEDDWRLNKSVTLNLGARYDVYTPYTEISNHISTFNAQTGALLVAGQNGVSSTAGIQTSYSGFQPRTGVAFNLGHGFVIRGGFGISFFPMNNSNWATLKGPPFVSTVSTCGTAPNATTPCPGITRFAQGLPATTPSTLSTPGVSIYAAEDTSYRASYALQSNVTAQKEWRDNVLTLSWVNMEGKDLFRFFPDLNSPGPTTLTGTAFQQARPYYSVDPLLGSVGWIDSHGYSNYNALRVIGQRRLSHGLSFMVNYTLSHNLGSYTILTTDINGSGSELGHGQHIAGDYGNLSLDVRSQVGGYFSYALPFGQQLQGLSAAVAKGWQLNFIGSWQTGLPFSILNSSNVENAVPGSLDRPNIIGNPNDLSSRTIGAFFDPSAFVSQPKGTVGNLGQYTLHGPHYRHLDMSLQKSFPLPERLSLDFQAQAFNLFNVVNFANPNFTLPASGSVSLANINSATLNSSHFGQITSTIVGYSPRVAQLSLALRF